MFSFLFPLRVLPDETAGPKKPSRFWPLPAAAFLIIACMLAAFSLLQYRKIMKDAELLLDSIAVQKSEQINGWRSSQLIEARETGGDREMAASATRAIRTGDPESMVQIVEAFDNSRESYDFQTSVLLDRHLIPIQSNARNLALSSLKPLPELREAFLQARDTGRPVITDILAMPESGEPVLEIIIPIFDRIRLSSNLAGYIVHYISAAEDLYRIVESWPFPSETGVGILVEKAGKEIKAISRIPSLSGTPFAVLPHSSLSESLASLPAERYGHLSEGRNHVGVWSFAVARPVKGTDWIFVAELSRREILKPWWRIFGFMAAFFVLGVALFLLMDRNKVLMHAWKKYETLLDTERKLRTAESKFSVFLDKMPSMAMIKDKDNRVLSTNKAMAAHFPTETWIGRTTEERLTPEQAALSLEWDRKVLETGYVEFEETRTDKHGKILHLLTQKFRIEGADGTPLIGLISTDLTERNRAERQIRELNAALEWKVKERTAQLEKANAEFQAFAYAVSHDLGSPLRTMVEYADLLKDECEESLGDTGRRHLAALRTASARMAGLMDDILELSRISNARMNIENVDIGKIADSIMSDHIRTDPERVVTISSTPCMHARCDAALVESLYRNLIDNAFKFTSGCKVADIELGSRQDAGGNGTETVYYVKDNGIGFDPANFDLLFKPFHRLNESDEYPGSGIGLAEAKRVVDRHGGRIWVESTPGKGTTVFFTLNPEPA